MIILLHKLENLVNQKIVYVDVELYLFSVKQNEMDVVLSRQLFAFV